MSRTKADQVPQLDGVPMVVKGPKDDDWRAREQDGQNKLLTEDQFMDRNRLMGNE